jgi:opacity protein-like surface antigen
MASLKTIAAIGTLTAALSATANAADLPRPVPAPSLPLPPPIVQRSPALVDEFASGWYLRGDVGYRINNLGSVANAIPPSPTSNRIDKSAVIGVGVGYKWQWFRADLTLDYGTKAKYWGDTVFMTNDFTARIDSSTALLNVYGDLGTWFGLTPYLGLGVGGSYVGVGDFSRNSLPAVSTVPVNIKWNLAWAWMAGVSYRLSQNYHIDLGYRHVSLGDGMSGMDAYGNQLSFKSLSADEIRLGVRYLID